MTIARSVLLTAAGFGGTVALATGVNRISVTAQEVIGASIAAGSVMVSRNGPGAN